MKTHVSCNVTTILLTRHECHVHMHMRLKTNWVTCSILSYHLVCVALWLPSDLVGCPLGQSAARSSGLVSAGAEGRVCWADPRCVRADSGW